MDPVEAWNNWMWGGVDYASGKDESSEYVVLPPGSKIVPIHPKKFVYIACPYNHSNPLIREKRFKKINEIAGNLMKVGMVVFSPISMSHPIAEQVDLPKGWDYWEKFDRVFLSLCSLLLVAQMEGWQESIGVQTEIKIAIELGIPIEYLEVKE